MGKLHTVSLRPTSAVDAGAVHRAELAAARWALALSVVIWSTPTIFQRWLLTEWDVATQNFYRYLVGFLSVLPFAIARARALQLRLTRRDLLLCAIPALPLVVHQVTQTAALYHIEPGIMTVIGRTSVLFTLVLSFAIFTDERVLIRRPLFLAGTLVGVGAAAGLFLAGSGGVGGGAISAVGVGLSLSAALGWALYSVLVKKFVAHLGATVGFTITSAWTCLLLLPIMVFQGRPLRPFEVSLESNVVMILSAVLCIGLGHSLFYLALRKLGAAVSQNAVLVSPLGAVLLSVWLFGEKITIIQAALGLVLLTSVALTMRETTQPPARTAPQGS